MSSVQQLRDFIRERLTAAAEEIFTQVEKTIVRYEEDIKLLEIHWKPQIRLSRADVPKQHEDEEEEVLTEQLCNPMMSWNENQQQSEPPEDSDGNEELGHPLLKEEAEAPRVKEERQEVCCSQEGQSLCFTQTMTLQQTDFSEEEPNFEHLDSNNVSALENQDEAGSCSPALACRSRMVPDESCGCHVCGKVFKSQYSMLRHLRVHSDEKPLCCEICGKVFVQTCHLKEHIQMHTGAKPFSCETCGKSFTRKSSLKVHRKTHTGDKPYSCETCGKRFSRSFCLKVHRKTHTGVKPFPCEICGKSFREKWYLKFHRKTHTGERPYPSQTGEESFNGANELIGHQKVHKPLRDFW